jgi:diguanylate cyclase (GGDEF)-like protein/PAS domain S-box-containing protein
MLYSGVQAVLIKLVAHRPAHYLVFAVMCFCAAGFQFGTAAYYASEAVAAAAGALHLQSLCLCIFMVAFTAFVAQYTSDQRIARAVTGVALFSLTVLLVDWMLPYGVRFQTLALAKPLQLPWGESLGHVSGRTQAGVGFALYVPFLLICGWALHRTALQYRAGEKQKARYLASCVALLIAGSLWGRLVDVGWIDSFCITGFAYIGFVLLMSVSMGQAQGRILAELRAERDRLHESQRKLAGSELRLSLVLKGTNDACWDWDIVQGRHTYSARGWEMLGYANEELPYDDETWERLVYPADRQLGQCLLNEAIRGGAEHYSFELRLRHKDGHPVPVLCRGYILREGMGRAIRVSGTMTDLTDRKQAALALRAEQQLNEQIFDHSPLGIAIFDRDGQCIAANEALARLLGRAVGRLTAQNLAELELWRASGIYELAMQTLQTGSTSSGMVRMQSSIGKDNWIFVNCRRLPDDAAGRVLAMANDLTAFRQAEQDRQEIWNTYEMLFTTSIDGVLQETPDGTIFAANPAACTILGLTQEQVCRGGCDLLFDLTDPRLNRLIEERARSGRARGEVTMVRGNGERFEAEVSSALYQNREGHPLASTMIRDVTQRKQAEAAAFQLAYVDSLTGLPNRRMLLDRVSFALESSKRSGSMGAVLFLDLDDFKRINDARGHSVGDVLLVQVAQRLTQLLHAVDMVGRLGGDEFVVLVNDLGTDAETAARAAMGVAEKVHKLLENPFFIDGFPYSGTGSIGLTMFPRGVERVDDLLREADTAMYRAKSMGRNRIAYYQSAMQAEAEERLALEQDLKEAVGTDQISVSVQPQFDIAGQEVGGELLLRWHHPERGGVSPADFIPIAEESGFILRLGDLVLRKACEALRRLERAAPALSISVNISPRQFRQDDFVEQVRAMLEETGAPPSRLTFEVTEGLLIEDWEDVASRMAQLATLGIRFSIDDFGTGYSSLAYLKKLPLHELKIDKSFVHDTPDDPDDTAIVRSILAMAKHFKLHVVAEGVETSAQAHFLADLHCDGLQGYYLARPLPLEAWLSSHGASAPTPDASFLADVAMQAPAGDASVPH